MKLREVLTCSALAALTCLLIAACALVCVATNVVSRLPQQLDAAVIETRAQVLGQVADIEHDTLKHLTALEAKADGRLERIQTDARAELAATRELVATQLGATLTRADTALAEVHGLRSDVAPTLGNLAGITESALTVTRQIAEASPLYLDCESNPSCVYNRVQGTSKAIEKAAMNIGAMSTEVRASIPQQLAAVEKLEMHAAGIAADVHTVTSEYTKPVGFWRKIWAGLKTAGVLYVRTL